MRLPQLACFCVGAHLSTATLASRAVANEAADSEAARSQAVANEAARSEPARSEPARSEPARSEPARSEPARSQAVANEAAQSEAAESEAVAGEAAESEAVAGEAAEGAVASESLQMDCRLSELGVCETLSDAEGPLDLDGSPVQLYGFVDFTYSALTVSRKNEWAGVFHPYPSFGVGNFNLYMASDLGPGWRSLGEVRFTYLPHGSPRQEASGAVTQTENTAEDYADFQRRATLGAIEIERAWLEYSHHELLTLRAGQWLTPYGIWNRDHGSPTLIATHRPFTIGEALFPERQAGLELYGRTLVGSVGLGYHLTLSNGRGPVDSYHDFDYNKALGLRFLADLRGALGALTAGVAGYKGRYTERGQVNSLVTENGETKLSVARPIVSRYDELSLAADLKWEYAAWQLQGELIMNEASHKVRRQKRSLRGPYFESDYRRWGSYGLVGYQLSFVPVMPYAMLEYYNFSNRPEVPPALGLYGGLNIRPVPRVTLKTQYTYGRFYGVGELGYGNDSIGFFEAQAAWSF